MARVFPSVRREFAPRCSSLKFLVLHRGLARGLFIFITGPSDGNMPRPIKVDQNQTSESFLGQMTLS